MIVINGMKMPKGCCECPLMEVHENGEWCAVSEICDNLKETKRPKGCPLVHIGVEIEGNPTNGDMIKALYLNASFVEVEYVSIIRMRAGDFYVDFNKEWWNAPYKRG